MKHMTLFVYKMIVLTGLVGVIYSLVSDKGLAVANFNDSY